MGGAIQLFAYARTRHYLARLAIVGAHFLNGLRASLLIQAATIQDQ